VLAAEHDGLGVRDALEACDQLLQVLLLGQPWQGDRHRDDHVVALDCPGPADEGLERGRVAGLHVPGGGDGDGGVALALAGQQRVQVDVHQHALVAEGERFTSRSHLAGITSGVDEQRDTSLAPDLADPGVSVVAAQDQSAPVGRQEMRHVAGKARAVQQEDPVGQEGRCGDGGLPA
jgi:hypothetical protein